MRQIYQDGHVSCQKFGEIGYNSDEQEKVIPKRNLQLPFYTKYFRNQETQKLAS